MLDVILTNPYRVLGVYSNSPKEDRIEALSDIMRFLEMGKSVSFIDLPLLMPEIERTDEMIDDANAKLTLPQERFLCAQFWFVNATVDDNIALTHLSAGDIDSAISVWNKNENVSSLQNRIVCNLILNNVSEAMELAEKLYESYKNDFVKAIFGNNPPIDTENVEYDFLDQLCNEIEVNEIFPAISNIQWKRHLSKYMVDELLNAISEAKVSMGTDTEAYYETGMKLMTDTKSLLIELKEILTESDSRYQMVADRVGLEILQYANDYFTHSDSYYAPQKAIPLISYAASIVVGEVAKKKCEENANIIQEAMTVDEATPDIIKEEADSIELELQKFYELPREIQHSYVLLNNIKPYLQSIKAKLGTTDSYYLKLSTRVVKDAYYNVMLTYNSLLEEFLNPTQFDQSSELKTEWMIKFAGISTDLKLAWDIFLIMDTFDLDDISATTYEKNRNAVLEICRRCCVKTETSLREDVERFNKVKKAHSRSWIILGVYEIIGLTLTLCVGLGYIALIVIVGFMVIGGLFIYSIFIEQPRTIMKSFRMFTEEPLPLQWEWLLLWRLDTDSAEKHQFLMKLYGMRKIAKFARSRLVEDRAEWQAKHSPSLWMEVAEMWRIWLSGR